MNESFQTSLSATLQYLKIKEKVLIKKWRWTSAKVMNKLCMFCSKKIIQKEWQKAAISLTFHDLSNKNHTKKDFVKKYIEFQADFEKSEKT
jgi:hypothetical protein